MPDTQEQLIAFLESPASYPHRPAEVRAIQTHISWVFIAPPLVFKVKKPVNLGFLDFSTLEKRHYFCQREIELNRRLCPEIYLDAVPICETTSGFSFNSEGEIVEYAVKMKELPHGWFLNELLEKNLVGEKEINRVISTLHRFYQAETPTPKIEQWGTPEKLKISTDENFTQVEPFIDKTISPAAFEAIRHYTNQFYEPNENLFHERIQQHRVLDCHGDLRSTTSISLRKRPPSSIALSLTTGFVSLTSPTISRFWLWILISKAEVTWEICFSEMLHANWAMQACQR